MDANSGFACEPDLRQTRRGVSGQAALVAGLDTETGDRGTLRTTPCCSDPRRSARRREDGSELIEWFDICRSRSVLARTIAR
jgi:hypothetical protein